MDEKEPLPVPVIGAPNPTERRRRRFRRILIFSSVLLLVWHFGLWSSDQLEPLRFGSFRHPPPGHPPHHGKKRKFLTGKAAEQVFLSVPNEETAHASSRLFASKPHIAGSDQDLQTAKDFLEFVQQELGIHPPPEHETPIFTAGSPQSQKATLSVSKTHIPYAWIDTYYPVLNTPLDRSLQVVDDEGNVVWEADLEEHADETDPDAEKYRVDVPAFHGLSAAGDVTGPLIHVNYGTKQDYDDLVAKGVNFTGAIVIARYFGNFRGLKIEGAENLGAAGVLIYSDPKDDGDVTVENGYDYYPNGPARNPTSVQRGSVQYISKYPGDPTTPGYPSYENSTRTGGENIPKIPSLPISWDNAKALLQSVEGVKGKKVRLVNHVDTKVTPIWNTYAVIPGFIKDEVVVVGNHRDAWVLGAADPTSGSATLNEVVRGLGELLRKGWKPLRTILVASWDGEEYGLVGSTEWGEDFAEWIDKNVVAYLNVDVSVSGSRFATNASPLLSHLAKNTALEIPHPTKEGKTLWDATTDTGDYFSSTGGTNTTVDEQTFVDSIGVGALGSGSDFTVFLQRLGVASFNHGFNPTKNDAVYHYHSIFDSVSWMEKYGDPGYHRHVAVAKHLGLLLLRLSDSFTLPLNNTHFARELENYLDGVQDIVKSQSSFKLDLFPLRRSIHNLQVASRTLDFERLLAEKEFEKAIKKWKKEFGKWRKLKRKLRKARCKIQKKLGHPCKKRHPHDEPGEDHGGEEFRATTLPGGGKVKPRIGRAGAYVWEKKMKEQEMLWGLAVHSGADLPHHCNKHHRRHRRRHQAQPSPDHEKDQEAQHALFQDDGKPRLPLPKLPKLPWRQLREAGKKIRAVNQKLIAIERGMISEEGIPEREWYRHLGVAPGKWLGYGATTFPALTEAITIEKNETRAEVEVQRLIELIDAISDQIAYSG